MVMELVVLNHEIFRLSVLDMVVDAGHSAVSGQCLDPLELLSDVHGADTVETYVQVPVAVDACLKEAQA